MHIFFNVILKNKKGEVRLKEGFDFWNPRVLSRKQVTGSLKLTGFEFLL